jgi:protein-tyrosine-phosphatase
MPVFDRTIQRIVTTVSGPSRTRALPAPPIAAAPDATYASSLLPDRAGYTRTWGPYFESAGVTFGVGLLAGLCAYRAWPAGMMEMANIFLSPEFLGDPVLLAGLWLFTSIPSLLWFLLHPWIDARRIDRNPALENRITRHYRRLLQDAAGMHTIAFLAAAGTGWITLDTISPWPQLSLALAVYWLTHATLHWGRNRFGFVFHRQTQLNVQAHLYTLLRTDAPRFQDTLRLLGAVSAFHHRTVDRIGPILTGTEPVASEALLQELDFLIRTFPPPGGLENILKLGATDTLAHYRPIADDFLAVLRSRTALSVGALPDSPLGHLLSALRREPPIRVLCACLHNHNRSPAMATALKALLENKSLTHSVAVDSGGIAPVARASTQLIAALKARRIRLTPPRPQAITDEALRAAHLVLAADVPTALTLALRLDRLEPTPEARDKIVLFTSLDRARFKGLDNLPDPYCDPVTIGEVLDQVQPVLEHVLLPILATTTIPTSAIALAGRLLRGFFPGDLPPYQLQKRMRLVLAITRDDPGYLIHIDRNNYHHHELSPVEVSFVWDGQKIFSEPFLAQLCDRLPDRKHLLEQSAHEKDYLHSVVTLHSLLSPVLHRIAKARQGAPI